MAFDVWTPPPTYSDGQNINKVVLNANLTANMKFLFRRPRHIITLRDVGSFTTTSTTFVAISQASLRLYLTVQSVVDLQFFGSITHQQDNTNTRYASFDIFMDNTTYLSSNDATALTNGIATSNNANLSSGFEHVGFNYIAEQIPAGDHYFDIHWRTTGNTLTALTNPLLQFGVKEF